MPDPTPTAPANFNAIARTITPLDLHRLLAEAARPLTCEMVAAAAEDLAKVKP
jgi:hypothetical protein